MTCTNEQKRILIGYGAAYALVLLSFVFTIVVNEGAGESIRWVPYFAAAAIVLRFTFAWGKLRGFPARSEDGHFLLSHILRNLTMSVIVWIALIALSAPVLPWLMRRFG